MKIILSTRGSRGDTYPILEVATRLQQAGHDVLVCVPALFAAQTSRLGLPTLTYSDDSEALMRRFGTDLKATKCALEWFTQAVKEQLTLLFDACDEADALVTTVNEIAAPTLAEHFGIPHYRVAFAPYIPGDGPPPLTPFQQLPPFLNRALWFAVNASTYLLFGKQLNQTRRRLGLAPIHLTQMGQYHLEHSHTLIACSAALGPRASGWKGRYTYVGYPFGLDEGPLPAAVEQFLAAGPPPVFLGLGSCSVPHPERFVQMIGEAVRRVGCRAIVGRGWARLAGEASEQLLFVDDTPHATLFPLTAGVAHHGGSGTTHNAARAGVPQFIMPQIVDQHYFGHRVHKLGLGPEPVPMSRLTAAKLTEALRALVHDEVLAVRARSLGVRMAHDDGAGAIAKLITDASARSRGKRRSSIRIPTHSALQS